MYKLKKKQKITMILRGPPTVELYFFVFYNVHSGNSLGKHLKAFAGQYIRLKNHPNVQVQMYDLLDEKESDAGYEFVKDIYNNGQGKILVASAGGDGTFVGILDKLMNMGVKADDPRLAFTAFAFGTGNDLTQSLRWERAIKARQTRYFDKFAKHLEERLSGNLRNMDIWQIHVESNLNGYVEHMSCGKIQRNQSMTRLMSNYMSVGLQGVIIRAFERRRRFTRAMNILEYMKQCLKIGIFNYNERVPKVLQDITENVGNSQHVFDLTKLNKHTVEVIIQNIPGIWGRQVNLWDTCALEKDGSVVTPLLGMADPRFWNVTDMGDGKLDIYTIKSRKDYAIKQFKSLSSYSPLGRIGQSGNEFNIHGQPGSTFHAMMDGECYKLHDIKEIQIVKRCTVQIIEAPVKK